MIRDKQTFVDIMDGESPSQETSEPETTSQTDTNNNNQVCGFFIILFFLHVIILKINNKIQTFVKTHNAWCYGSYQG